MPQSFDSSDMEERCSPYQTISRGDVTAENNTWGAGSTPSQCIYASSGPNPRFGWTWNYPQTSPDSVKAYPELIFGKKPWANSSTTPLLPCPLSPVPALSVQFDSQTQANGRYNAAFELWLTRSAEARSTDISHEVMFWVGSQGGAHPAGGPTVTGLTLETGRVCSLWTGSVQSWGYSAFVFLQPFASGTINFTPYLSYLLQQGRINPAHFLASLEFGNEVWYGSGETEVRGYRVSMPGGPPVGPSGPELAPAHIRLEVPPEAQVFVEGVFQPGDSAQRVFVSTPLEPGRRYGYQIRVVLEQPGRRVEETRDLVVLAGERYTLSFQYADANA